jgi:C4-type Zn-finger protein
MSFTEKRHYSEEYDRECPICSAEMEIETQVENHYGFLEKSVLSLWCPCCDYSTEG